MSNTNALWKLAGTWVDHRESLVVAFVMLLVTVLYESVSLYIVPEYALNMFEFVGTWTGLTCVWLSRTRNILCWPWGIVSALALGYFFMQIALPGQQWLNWGYFLVIQLWAWPYWAFGGEHRDTLPVSTLSWTERVMYTALIAAGTLLTLNVISYISPGSFHPVLDATVVASSVVAQFLLGRKKVESWILWLGPVNMLSVYLFFMAGAYTLTALYVAFFIHAAFAIRSWYVALGKEGGISVQERVGSR